MSTDIISIVNAVLDSQPASVTLTDTAGKRIKLPCVFKESTAPSFCLLFSPGILPADIKTDWRCIFVGQDGNGETITFSASIVELTSSRVIELVANKSIRPEDLREYFRVNLKTGITVFYDPKTNATGEQSLELDGETVDLSQSGVLAIFSDECKISKPVQLALDLPNPARTVICSGRLVRCKNIRKNRWLTSFHFEDISSKDREVITKNCFSEQRRQLRENIQTAW